METRRWIGDSSAGCKEAFTLADSGNGLLTAQPGRREKRVKDIRGPGFA